MRLCWVVGPPCGRQHVITDTFINVYEKNSIGHVKAVRTTGLQCVQYIQGITATTGFSTCNLMALVKCAPGSCVPGDAQYTYLFDSYRLARPRSQARLEPWHKVELVVTHTDPRGGGTFALRGGQGARRAAKTENRPRVANGPPGAETSIPSWGHHAASAGELKHDHGSYV
jgi:hypothetical protein